MSKFDSAERAYQELAGSCIDFANERQWQFVTCKVVALGKMARVHHLISFEGAVSSEGLGWPDSSLSPGGAALFLRDELLRTTGQRIWGLTFTLYPDGKFNIEYDYNKPEWYDEEEEASEQDGANGNANELAALAPRLQALGVEVASAGDAGQPQGLASACQAAMAWLREVTEEQGRQWGLGQEVNWNVDLNEGWLRWSFEGGRVMQADVQVIGTYNTRDGSFLWGWDHPSVPAPVRRAAQGLRAWGEARAEQALTTRSVAATEQQAWEWTALAAQRYGASGAYRGRSDATWVYMVYGPVSEI